MGRFVSLVKTYGRLGVLLACLFFSYKAYPSVPRHTCGKLAETVLLYMSNGYGATATAIKDNTMAVQLMINPETKNWIILGIDDNQGVCVIMQGTDWNWMAEREL